MTKSLSTSSMVSSASGKKCKKPCQSSSSSSSCCTEQCIDCCSSQYQRLSEVRNLVAAGQVTGVWTVDPAQINRCGTVIPNPNTSTANTVGASAGAYHNAYSGCSGSTDVYLPKSFSSNSGAAITNLAYQFVNQFAYGPYEPGCHNDQVTGWFVDVQSG